MYYILDNNYKATNNKTLDFIDEQYFSSMQEIIDSEKTSNLFLYYSLFQHYFSSLEIMFSHIGAAFQAPYFYYPWIMEYKTKELYSVVKTINNNGVLKNPHSVQNVSWNIIADIIHPNIKDESDKKRNNMFAQIWEKMADDFLNSDYQEAYNSIKHGLRVKNDAIKNVQIEDLVINGSDYGIEYGVIENKKGINVLKTKIVNMNSAVYDYAFEFIKGTMINIKNFLKLVNTNGPVNIVQYQPREDVFLKYLELEPPSISSATFNI